MGTNAVSALHLRQIPGTLSGILEADKVSIVIGQDYDFAATLSGLAQKHAAIGTMLGTRAACEVNQSIAEVEVFNLTDELRGKWITAGLSNHVKVVDQEAALDTLDTKGYIFADTYTGVSGYRWSDEATCTPVIIDADGNMNEHTISLGATKDFAMRRVRAALLPQVKKTRPVDPATGLMTTGTRVALEKLVEDEFEDLAANGWISGGAASVDPASDLMIEKTVRFSYSIVPYGTVGQLTGTANLKKSLN
jgi:hypothetical protein